MLAHLKMLCSRVPGCRPYSSYFSSARPGSGVFFSPSSGGLHSSIQILERLFFWTRYLNFLGGLHRPSMIIFSFMAYVSSLISVSRSIGHNFELDYLLLEILQICSIFWFQFLFILVLIIFKNLICSLIVCTV